MRVLFICTGNLCRSPIAERLARAHIDAHLGAAAAAIGLESAGTRAAVGKPMDPSAARVLAELGGRSDGFRARQLTATLVRQADLVLTLTRQHRQSVLELTPGALRRTFTLAEAAALIPFAAVDPHPAPSLPERGTVLVAALNAARARRPGIDRDNDDIADPVGRPVGVHRTTAAVINDRLTPVLSMLCATDAPAPATVPMRL
ncbi:low molecular weight phosphatase family protein [Blastococcus sp. KM273128]|uniref:arsenate reductase/protein-tyrosine-phosphatase family protein n=1 Tax=Blastococcus sp. KM273128 TaxID=2570314 RepID=UPI001F3374DC|nr:hypothetical protein [Blastococcus sp. KM273128]MCF6745190.1 low molecular weight phosphatase family protein [Blastococcus sp. KM273128]